MTWRAVHLLGCYSAAMGAVEWGNPFLRALGIVAAVGWGISLSNLNAKERRETVDG